MRFDNFSIAGSFLVVVLLMVGWPGESNFGSPSKSIAQDVKQPAEKNDSAKNGSSSGFSPGTEDTIKAEKALKQRVSLKFGGTPFSEVEKKLESLTGLNFLLNQSATDDSLTLDEEISFELADVPLNKALQMLLETKNATYVIDDGIVVIISRDDAEDTKWLRLKMYDCSDLVKVLLAKNRPDPNGEQTLIDMVQTLIGPDSWVETGQGLASIYLAKGTLVVTQTEEIHQQIEKFLKDLKASIVPKTDENSGQSPAKKVGKAQVFNLPAVSSAKTADQLLHQLEKSPNQQYIKPSLSKAELEEAIEKLRSRFPLKSIRDRLHFQGGEPTRAEAEKPGEVVSKKRKVADLGDYQPAFSYRRDHALALLHSKHVESFIEQNGQGLTRMTPTSPQDLFWATMPVVTKSNAQPVDSALRFEKEVELDKTIKMKESRARARMGQKDPDYSFVDSLSSNGLPKQQKLSLFNKLAAGSFAGSRMGYVKNIDEVAGFEAHRIRMGYPEVLLASKTRLKPGDKDSGPAITWKTNRFQLVSLLMHDQPSVYDVDELPNMENLSSADAKTRPLDEFELEGLKSLKAGEELLVRATRNRILMVGSIRASKQCLACHTGKENDLLGAFSYEFLRHPRVDSEPVK